MSGDHLDALQLLCDARASLALSDASGLLDGKKGLRFLLAFWAWWVFLGARPSFRIRASFKAFGHRFCAI